MEIRDGILYASVAYPKDIKEVHTQAVRDGLKGYSVHTEDGRYFKWNEALSKPETIQQNVYFLAEPNTVNATVEVKTPIKESNNVQVVREKIQNLKAENTALSRTVATLTSEKQQLEKQVKDKDMIISELENKNAKLEAEKKQLQSDIDEIVKL